MLSRLRRPRGPAAAAAGLLVVVVLVLLLREQRGAGAAQRIVRYAPAASLPRLDAVADGATERAFAPGVAHVADFDATEQRLVLLDAMNAQIVVLERNAAGWSHAFTFGRRGAGPGELGAPSGIALTDDGGILVADEATLHRYAADGGHRGSIRLRASCPLSRPRVAAADSGLFVSGTCLRSGTQTDSFVAVLYWMADDSTFVEVASDLHYTRDGKTGLPIGSTAPFHDAAARHLFGTGTSNCIYDVAASSAAPAAARRCDLVSDRYSAAPPPETLARLERERARRPELRNLMRWPDAMPIYISATSAGSRRVLLRPFAVDSVVFELIEGRAHVLVASLDGFVRCRRYGCLWSHVNDDGVGLTILPNRQLADIIGSAGARP